MKEQRLSKENKKNIWKLVLLTFIISVIILNWSDIYWVFNPKVTPQLIKQTIINQEDKKDDVYYDKINTIEIPAIEITAPIVETTSTSNNDFQIALDKGVVHFPGSANPGEVGIAIILGHSAPPGWPKIKYDWIFSDLNNLKQGDEIEIYFNNKKYVYLVTEKIFLEIGQDVPSSVSSKAEIILLSCWPPGKNIQRIGVRGVLKTS